MARKVVPKWRVGCVYIVSWLDHHDVSTTWTKGSDLVDKEEIGFTSVGTLVKDEPKYITMASTVEIDPGDDPTYSNVFRILKSAVTECRKLD